MTRNFAVSRWSRECWRQEDDTLSLEEPLLIKLNGSAFATLMRTPGEDAALVRGFLYGEGLIRTEADLLRIVATDHPTSHEMEVELRGPLNPTLSRSVYLSSSCGVCGRSSVEGLLDRMEPITPLSVSPHLLQTIREKFGAAQRQFPQSGGVHGAALFNAAGELLDLAEDVGRHNALDKLVGRAISQGSLPWAQKIVLMSSRASFDIIQKAGMAGAPVVAVMGAASSLAAELALRAGIALYCFLRPGSVVRIGSQE